MRYPEWRKGGTVGPPIIDAIAGVPLTQNKISARNVLCTPPSTRVARARKGQEGGRREWAVHRHRFTLESLPPLLTAASLRLPLSSSPAPREPVSLLHANSIRGFWHSRGIPYYDTGGLKEEKKNERVEEHARDEESKGAQLASKKGRKE